MSFPHLCSSHLLRVQRYTIYRSNFCPPNISAFPTPHPQLLKFWLATACVKIAILNYSSRVLRISRKWERSKWLDTEILASMKTVKYDPFRRHRHPTRPLRYCLFFGCTISQACILKTLHTHWTTNSPLKSDMNA